MLNRLSQQRVKSFLSGFLTFTLGLTILSPSAEARLIFTTEDDGAESDTYTLDVDGTVNLGDNIDLSLIFGANLGEELRYNDSLGYFILTDDLNFEGNEIQEFKIGSNAGAPVLCNATNVGYTYYDTTTASVMICNETSVGSGTYAFNSVEDITAGSITTTEILDGTIATVDVADNAITTDKIGTAGVADANKLLGTDASGNPQWEDKSDFVSSALTSGQMLVGNGSGVATGVTISGDATISNTGALSLANNSVDSAEIAANAVDTAELADSAVTSAKILDGTVSLADLNSDSVNSARIVDGSITADDLGVDSVGASEIAANAVDSAEIAADAVGSSEIAADAVGASELADNAVDTASIQNDAVTADKLADGAVSGGLLGQIVDASITAADLGSNSVEADEIATNAVGALEIADNAVDTNAVQDDAITLAKIGTAGVSDADSVLTTDASGNPQWEDRSSFATSNLASGNIFVGNALNNATSVAASGDVTVNNVGSFTIADNAVDGTDIALGSDTAGDLMYYNGTDWVALGIGAAGEVLQTNAGATAPEWTTAAAGDFAGLSDTNFAALADGQVAVYDADTGNWLNVTVSGDVTFNDTGDMQIVASSITAAEIAANTITAAEIAADAVTASELADDAVDTAAILDDAVTGAKIDDGTITAADIDLSDLTLNDFTNDAGFLTTVDISDDTNLAVGDGVVLTDDTLTATLGTAIDTSEITDGTITTADINLAGFEVDSAQIAADAITASELADNAVDTDAIADNAVDGSKLGIGTTAGDTLFYDGTDWVRLGIGTSGQVLQTNTGATAPEWANSVSSFSGQSDTNFVGLADGNITVYDATNSEWINVAVSGDATIDETGDLQFGAGSVTAAEIATGAVGTDEITDGSITTADLNLAGFEVDTAQIADDAVTADQIATGAVTTTEILDGTILAGDLADGSINGGTAGVITDDSITAADIAAGGVGTSEVLDGSLTGADLNLTDITLNDFTNDAGFLTTVDISDDTNLAAGTGATLTGDTISVDLGTSIDSAEIEADTIVAADIATGAVTTDEILDNTIGTDDIAANAVTIAEIGTAGVGDANSVLTTDGAGDPQWEDRSNFATSTLTTDNLFVGVGGVATDTAVSGDLTMTAGNFQIAADAVGSAEIADDAVTASELADNAVDTAAILNANVTAAKLADGAVNGGLAGVITDNSVTADDLAPNSVTASELADGSVDTAAIQGDAVTTAEIAADTITAADIAAEAITASELADDAVDTAAIANDAVTSAKIDDGTITAADLLANTLTAGQIADNAITAAELADNAVDTAAILDDAVTEDKIDFAGVTLNDFTNDAGFLTTVDISDDTNLAAGTGITLTGDTLSVDLGTTIESSEITDGTIATADLANNAVDGAKIALTGQAEGDLMYYDGTDWVVLAAGTAGQVLQQNATADAPEWAAAAAGNFAGLSDTDFTGLAAGDFAIYDGTEWVNLPASGDITIDAAGVATIAADAVTATEIATGAVTTDEILDGTIAAADIAANTITAGEIATGAVTTDEILDGTIAAADIAANTITAGEIATGAVGTDEITDGSITTADIDLTGFEVDTAQIATGAVTTDEILDGTIATADIADGAITGGLAGIIADGSITADDLGTDSVDSEEIATDAVTTDEILDGTITQDDVAERESFYTLAPEFSNFTLRADGSDNSGTMYSDHDTGTDRNYYAWSTRRTGALNDYDLVLQWMVPENFVGFSDTNPEIEIDYKTDLTTAADNRLDIISLLDTNGSNVALTGGTGLVSTIADTWVDDADVTFAGGTFTPGEYITMTFRFASKGTTRTNANPVYLGPVKFNVKVKQS